MGTHLDNEFIKRPDLYYDKCTFERTEKIYQVGEFNSVLF